MRIAIVGSRGFNPLTLVQAFIYRLGDEAFVVTGDARGVDQCAAETAMLRGLSYQVFKARWRDFGRAAGPMRNQLVVDDCDRLVAFWDGRSAGTRDAIARARDAGKLYRIYRPDGTYYD